MLRSCLALSPAALGKATAVVPSVSLKMETAEKYPSGKSFLLEILSFSYKNDAAASVFSPAGLGVLASPALPSGALEVEMLF